MNKFTSIDELRSVKRRLYFKKDELEKEIKNNFSSIKESWTPAGIFHNLTSSIHSHNGLDHPSKHETQKPGIVQGAAAAVIDLIVNDLFLRKSSYVKKLMMSYVIRMMGPTLLNNAGPLIKNLLHKAGLFQTTKSESPLAEN